MSKAIGIRELKAHFSRYVKEVRDGGEILVSDRGRVVARLVPVEDQSEETRPQSLLLKLPAGGQIILPRLHKKATRPAGRKKVKGSTFSDDVLEGRR